MVDPTRQLHTWRDHLWMEQTSHGRNALVVLCNDSHLVYLVILIAVLAPQQQLMRQALECSGDQWEAAGFGKQLLAAPVKYVRKCQACLVAGSSL